MKRADPSARKGRRLRPLPILLGAVTFWALLSLAVYKITARFPEWVSRFYSSRLYPVITAPGRLFASLFPFSLAELLLFLLLFALLFFLGYSTVRSVRLLIKKKPRPFLPLLRFTAVLLILAESAVCLFVWTGGLNYNAAALAEKEGFSMREHTPQELYELTVYFLGNAAAVRRPLTEAADGSVLDSRDFSLLCETAETGFQKIAGRYGMASGRYVSPKPAFFSLGMCYTNTTGIYPYLLPEPIINTMTPSSSLPSTICHEMAHQRAIAREDEAGFVSFAACMNTGDPYFIYSAYYMAVTYCLNALYSVNYELWTKAWQQMSEEMRTDIRCDGEFWSRFETPAAALSDTVNDLYLQANNIEDGTASYGRLVDLLLCYYLD